VTPEATVVLREASADAARVMRAPERARYAVIIGEALGAPASSLEAEWERHASEVRAQDVRDRLRRWAVEWADHLESRTLTEHLEEAWMVVASARAELAGHRRNADARTHAGERARRTSHQRVTIL
jgi:hypothetical protein